MSVQYELDGAVAVVTVDDGKANAYTHELLAELVDALDRAEREARAVLLSGRPGRFSAGFDLATMTAGVEPMRALMLDGGRAILRLFASPLPVVVACTGHALAAGALVLLAGDHRVGAQGEFRIGLNEVAIGLALPDFAVELARYRMPPSRFDAVLLGDVVDPDGAVASGFLDRVVAPDALVEEARAAAARYAELDPTAVRETKRRARGELAARLTAGLADDLATVAAPSQVPAR